MVTVWQGYGDGVAGQWLRCGRSMVTVWQGYGYGVGGPWLRCGRTWLRCGRNTGAMKDEPADRHSNPETKETTIRINRHEGNSGKYMEH